MIKDVVHVVTLIAAAVLLIIGVWRIYSNAAFIVAAVAVLLVEAAIFEYFGAKRK